jgi:PEGA domain
VVAIDTGMMRFVPMCALAVCLILSGCARDRSWLYFQHVTSDPPPEPAVDMRGDPISRPELTPDGRWVKRVDIRSEPQGARIMVAGYYVGETPMQVEIPCTPNGRFTRATKIRLLPTVTGGQVHSAAYPAGATVPSRLSFAAPVLPSEN